jgi:oligopeptide transport system substrate-binding protein
MGLNVSLRPFDDLRVRRAFVLAIDRETLADVILRGYVSPATGGFVPPGMPGHSAGIALPYNPEQARQLLAEAGYPGGRGFPKVGLLTGRSYDSKAKYLQTQWQENLGLEITWETMEWKIYLDRLRKERPHMFIHGWVADYPDPDYFLRVGVESTLTGWRSETYDELIEKAKRVTDRKARMRLYQKADRILMEGASIIPLTYGWWHVLVKPWVRNLPVTASTVWLMKDVIIEPH